VEESKHKANPATIFTFLEVTYAGVPFWYMVTWIFCREVDTDLKQW